MNIVQKNEFVFVEFPCELLISILLDDTGPLNRFCRIFEMLSLYLSTGKDILD